MNTNSNTESLLKVLNFDIDFDLIDIRETLDIYRDTKEIMDKADYALGRKIDYELINASSSNSYNLPLDGICTKTEI